MAMKAQMRYNRTARKTLVVLIGGGFLLLFGGLLLTTSVREPSRPKTPEEQKECREQQFDPLSQVIQLHGDNFHEEISKPGTTWFIIL
jgi:hypothetical protein